jgi:heat shock protein HtpX
MIKNQLKTVFLLGALTAILLVIGGFFGRGGLTIAIIFAVLMNFGAYFFSDRIVLAMYRAKEIKQKDNPELFKLVRDVVHLANIPMPKVYIVPSMQSNAFATGRNPKNASVAFTNGILNLLSRDELKGVIAHELSHIKNRDILIQTIASTIAGVISYLAFMARWGAIFGGVGGDRDRGNIIELLAIAIITPILAMLIQLAISRSREYLADSTGAKMIHNPLALARALEKLEHNSKHTPMGFGGEATSSLFIVNPFSGRGLVNLLSTHPPVKSRVEKLRNMDI